MSVFEIASRSWSESIAAIQKTGVLHDEGGFDSGEVRPRANTDALFFTTKRHMPELAIVLHRPDHFHHLFIRQRRDQFYSRAFERADNQSGVCFGIHNTFNLRMVLRRN